MILINQSFFWILDFVIILSVRKILKFDNSLIYLENLRGVADTNYIGYHVVFPEQEHKIVGEIVTKRDLQKGR